MVHRLSDILFDGRVMAQNILYSIFACLPCKMHRPIWAEHQPLATSPCPPLLYQYMSSSLRTYFIIVVLVDRNFIPRQAAGQQILSIVEPNWHKQAANPIFSVLQALVESAYQSISSPSSARFQGNSGPKL